MSKTKDCPGKNAKSELADYARAIRQGALPASTPKAALQDVALIETKLESVRTGMPARLQRVD